MHIIVYQGKKSAQVAIDAVDKFKKREKKAR